MSWVIARLSEDWTGYRWNWGPQMGKVLLPENRRVSTACQATDICGFSLLLNELWIDVCAVPRSQFLPQHWRGFCPNPVGCREVPDCISSWSRHTLVKKLYSYKNNAQLWVIGHVLSIYNAICYLIPILRSPSLLISLMTAVKYDHLLQDTPGHCSGKKKSRFGWVVCLVFWWRPVILM